MSPRLRPSASGLWSRCSGYVVLNDACNTVEVESEAALDGTAAHWAASEAWAGREIPVGTTAPNGREITEEMGEAVSGYIGFLRSVSDVWCIEQPVKISAVLAPICDGTPDAWTFRDDTLWVVDFKFGFRPIEAWKNTQLSIYAHALLKLKAAHCKRVMLAVYQPRAPHHIAPTRVWATTPERLEGIVAILQKAAEDNLSASPRCTPNPYCADCAAASQCTALQAAAGGAADVGYRPFGMPLTKGELAYEMSVLSNARDRIEQRLTALEAEAEVLIGKGEKIPGWEMVPGRTNWRWKDQDQIRRLGEIFGIDVYEPQKVRSVAKMRKVFPGLDVEALFAEKPKGAPGLKRAKDVTLTFLTRNGVTYDG